MMGFILDKEVEKIMTKPIKDMFLDIIEEWDSFWRDSIEFYDFVNDYVEINDDHNTFVVKKKKHKVEVEE